MGFGGNNGLTDFKDILGFDLQADTTRAGLFFCSALALMIGYLISRFIVTSKLGRVLIAMRDSENRARFLGYRVEYFKLFVFVVSAMLAGVAGALYVRQMDVITGKTRPDEGTICFSSSRFNSTSKEAGKKNTDYDLTKFDETSVANLGVGRKFQKPSVIESLTIFENLEMSLKGGRSIWQSLFHKLSSEQKAKLDEILGLIDMSDKAHDLAGNLSHGQKQWLEIGMLLGQEPEFLLYFRFCKK